MGGITALRHIFTQPSYLLDDLPSCLILSEVTPSFPEFKTFGKDRLPKPVQKGLAATE